MTPWIAIAKALGHETTKAMWEDLYTKRGKSLEQLASQLGVSVGTIRARLREDSIQIRARGTGRGTTKVQMTEELVTEVRRDGCRAVAARLGVTYSTVYKALKRKGLTQKGLPPEQVPTATDASHPPEADGHDESQ